MKEKLGELSPRRFFLETWRELNREFLTRRAQDDPARFEWKVLVVLVVAAVSLTLMEYWGDRTTFLDLVPNRRVPYWDLKSFAYWSGWRFLGYAVIPGITIALLPGERLADYGLSFKGFFSHVWIYVFLFLCVLPMIVLVSFTEDFRTYYPFYEDAGRSAFDFWVWEALYALQFLSLEFFFRGYLLHALKKTMGSYAIFVMVVPYNMIHYGKPFLEANAAIVAGIILGTLALKTRSIWCGFLIHVSVAISMDLAALTQRREILWFH
jgi:membrane protease YdiL (CAAX protease family)